jgi:Xaa-Pro aminopeptidase
MLQSFEERTRPENGPPRLAALRVSMEAEGLDGYLVPRADRHQGEYVAACDERLAWLTGFTGSAGFAAVLTAEAGVFVDGRYRLQARAQMASDFAVVNWPETKLGPWLRERLKAGSRVGFDPWLHTPDQIEALRADLSGSGIELVSCGNLVDRLWQDRPLPPAAPAEAFPAELAGRTSVEKRALVAATLAADGQAAAVLTLPDSIAWLLNIRGADLPRLPVVQAYAIIHADARVHLFSVPEKFEALGPDPAISVRPWAEFESALAALGDADGPVRLDPATAPMAAREALERAGARISAAQDPCLRPKACKTTAEIEGMRAAHLRDGAAMCRFLAWLARTAPGQLTEIDVVRRLEAFRDEVQGFRDISFETIAGSGPHGAIVHYRVTEATNRPLAEGELLLVDSGAQYRDGTTDVTRTIAVGAPGEFERDAFTRVLRGMIAISRARWPRGLAGRDLDALARAALWQAGLDYDHGTGHGVGHYLSVHEGPQSLSRRSNVPFEPGMVVSNEPGYYRAGRFGIRSENLLAVIPAPPLEGADPREMLAFETLTLAPIDRALILPGMLSAEERGWLDAYHARVLAEIGPSLGAEDRGWLAQACAPI